MSATLQIKPEAGVPPSDSNTLSNLSVFERARLACDTIKVLFPDAPDPSEEEKEVAREAFKELTTPTTSSALPALPTYSTGSMRYLDSLLTEYDQELVNSAVRIREYVKNKLLLDSENPDGKIRIRALELLGKIKDVGLFTDRIEVTHKNKTDEELADELKTKLERFMGSVLPVEDAEEVEDGDEEPMQLVDSTDNVIDLIDSLATGEEP